MAKYNLDVDINKPNITMSTVATQWNTYTMLNYDKHYVCYDDVEVSKYKSVIMDANTKTIYSFSPPKSITYESFMASNPDLKSPDIVVTEIIQGIMVNLWYDRTVHRWEISTRDCIGGMEFEKEAFMTAFGCEPDIQDINDDPFIRQFTQTDEDPLSYTYSFVLDVVSPTPQLYLIARYKIDNHTVYDETDSFILFKRPSTYSFPTYQDLSRHFTTIQGSREIVGAMLYNKKTGQRARIFNQAYLDFMELRYIDACSLYQYLALRYVNKMQVDLGFEPCAQVVMKFIQNILDSYKARYVKRTGEIISHRYMPIIYKLHHNIYLPSLKQGGEKTVVTKEVITNYVDRWTPTEFFNALYCF